MTEREVTEREVTERQVTEQQVTGREQVTGRLRQTPAENAVERRRRHVSEEILDAAWELCRRDGLGALSLRELAAMVGMRAPSLYSYFSSKNAIYDAMFAQGQHQLAAHMSGVPLDAITREDLRRATRAFFEFCVSDSTRYQLLFQRPIPGFEPSAESYGLAADFLDDIAEKVAAAGFEDPRHLDLWTAVVTGLTDQQISNDPGGQRWARLIDEAVDMLCDHIGVP